MAVSHVFPSMVSLRWIKREECAAQVQLRAGGLWERQDESQRQLQPLRQVHGHQLQLQRRSHRRTHQQLPAGEGEGGRKGLTANNNRGATKTKQSRAPVRHVYWGGGASFSWMLHEVTPARCEGTSMNRCVCEGALRVNERLTWGHSLPLC